MCPRTRFLARTVNEDGEHHQHGEQEHVLLGWRVDSPAEQLDRAGGHRPGMRIVGEPLHAREQPVHEELRRERRHRQIQALDAQAGHAEHHADRRRYEAGEDQHHEEVQRRYAQHQVIGRVCAHRHERRVPDRDLAAVAHQQVEPYGGQRQDQERDDHGQEQVVAHREGHDEERERKEREHQPAVLRDRQHLLVGAVGGLELAVFAVQHLRPDRCGVRRRGPRAAPAGTAGPARRRTSSRSRRRRGRTSLPAAGRGILRPSSRPRR
jgi:hypothetical protein